MPPGASWAASCYAVAMPKVIKETRETRADPKRLPTVDITGRQRLTAPRRHRDAARRGQALVDGQGVINETVLLCRAVAKLTVAQTRSVRRRSTLDEIYSLTFGERIILKVRGPE